MKVTIAIVAQAAASAKSLGCFMSSSLNRCSLGTADGSLRRDSSTSRSHGALKTYGELLRKKIYANEVGMLGETPLIRRIRAVNEFDSGHWTIASLESTVKDSKCFRVREWNRVSDKMSNENLDAENKIAGFLFTRGICIARSGNLQCAAREIAMRAAPHPPVRAHCNAPTPKATATVQDRDNVGQVTRGSAKSLVVCPTFHP
jgi:hypothetical protein